MPQDALTPELEPTRLYFGDRELEAGSYVTLPSMTVRVIDDVREFEGGQRLQFAVEALVKDVVFKNIGELEKDAARVHVAKATAVHLKVQ